MINCRIRVLALSTHSSLVTYFVPSLLTCAMSSLPSSSLFYVIIKIPKGSRKVHSENNQRNKLIVLGEEELNKEAMLCFDSIFSYIMCALYLLLNDKPFRPIALARAEPARSIG